MCIKIYIKISAQTLYRQKLQYMLNSFAADNMGLPLLVLTQLLSKNPCKNARRTSAKTI